MADSLSSMVSGLGRSIGGAHPVCLDRWADIELLVYGGHFLGGEFSPMTLLPFDESRVEAFQKAENSEQIVIFWKW